MGKGKEEKEIAEFIVDGCCCDNCSCGVVDVENKEENFEHYINIPTLSKVNEKMIRGYYDNWISQRSILTMLHEKIGNVDQSLVEELSWIDDCVVDRIFELLDINVNESDVEAIKTVITNAIVDEDSCGFLLDVLRDGGVIR